MEAFRLRLKYRIFALAGLILAAVILGFYSIYAIGSVEQAGYSEGMIAGFQFGILCSLGIIALVRLIRYVRVLHDNTKLNLLYNEEHDERLKAIRSKAGMPLLLVTSVMMLIAAIIGGYFNIIIFYTLVITATVQLTIGAVIKLYCRKTM